MTRYASATAPQYLLAGFAHAAVSIDSQASEATPFFERLYPAMTIGKGVTLEKA
jgi:hypothetical protein